MKEIEIQPGLKLEDILQQVKQEDLVLTENGHAVALLSEMDDDELYWYRREHDPAFIASIAAARQHVAQGRAVKLDDLVRELDIE